MAHASKTPTTEQLREEIDRGQAADKAAGADPAAAPLGTDDEAGGNPPTPEQRAIEAEALRHEDPRRPSGGGNATESIRNVEPEAPTPRLAKVDRPSEGGGARESMRAGEEAPERDGRAEEVIPSREDDEAGALSDDPFPPQRRPSDAP